jgi:hypothetical protein
VAVLATFHVPHTSTDRTLGRDPLERRKATRVNFPPRQGRLQAVNQNNYAADLLNPQLMDLAPRAPPEGVNAVLLHLGVLRMFAERANDCFDTPLLVNLASRILSTREIAEQPATATEDRRVPTVAAERIDGRLHDAGADEFFCLVLARSAARLAQRPQTVLLQRGVFKVRGEGGEGVLELFGVSRVRVEGFEDALELFRI